ncbi:MAG TPA: di-heme oxidoredictase family protein [Myxococcales bacterium]|jgi:CxxC motif-containing protein (DUF1111 family)|nr:di-heme oxidoredictase family protein [Myxococcales bacterium]
MTALRAGCLGAVLLSAAAFADFGDPLPGLTADELAAFAGGKVDFTEVETVAEGLGPVFNEASCVACHAGPNGAVGGTNQRLETRFGRYSGKGTFDPLTALGGSLLQDHSIGPNGNGHEYKAESVPSAANVVAQRRTTPLFGLGLVDATPASTFLTLALAQAIVRPSIAGTPSMVTDPLTQRAALGKFGWKAQVPSLFVFAGDAYLNEMGITNPIFPNENCPQGDCAELQFNPLSTLNDDGEGVEKLAHFMTFLAPPPRGAQSFVTEYGNRVASAIGCLDCHTQTLRTGPNAVAALNEVVYHPFSDFLLHDMGSLGDGITQNRATGRLIRTQPLWGLRTQTQLLHDGRAHTIVQAILAHDGQGRAARARFERLSAVDRRALLAFLQSL